MVDRILRRLHVLGHRLRPVLSHGVVAQAEIPRPPLAMAELIERQVTDLSAIDELVVTANRPVSIIRYLRCHMYSPRHTAQGRRRDAADKLRGRGHLIVQQSR
jgi:hypothetical protein